MGTLTIITPPTGEPVSIKELKDELRIECDEESEAKLLGYLSTARQWAEQYCDLYIMQQTVEWSNDGFPSTQIKLDVWPIQSIDSVKYDDTASPVTEQTLVVNTDYYANTVKDCPSVTAVAGWPSTASRPETVRIRMTAGYTSAEVVPQQLKQGIMMYAGSLYECNSEMEQSAKNMLWPLRRNV